MSINNALSLPYVLSNGTTADAAQVQANFNYLLAALNRALLDQGGVLGMSASSTALHNISDALAAQDAAAYHQINDAIVALNLSANYAPLASPFFSGTPQAPTAPTVNTGNQIATLDYAIAQAAAQLAAANLAQYAPLASPALTGTPTAPTAALGTNTTQIATMAAVLAAGANVTVVGSGFKITFGGGYMLQLQRVATTAGGGTAFSFPTPYVSTPWAGPVAISGLSGSGSLSMYLGPYTLTNTGATVYGNNGASANGTAGIISFGK